MGVKGLMENIHGASDKSAKKTLHNTDASGAEKNVPDIVKYGYPDHWQLICKASSEAEGWMKSTKAMEVLGGCIIQVTTQQRNPDGSYALAEALTYVPGTSIETTLGSDESPAIRTLK